MFFTTGKRVEKKNIKMTKETYKGKETCSCRNKGGRECK